MSLEDILQTHAAAGPDAPFGLLPLDDRVLTFSGLASDSARVGEGLKALGLSRGARVSIIAARSSAFVSSYLGAIRRGFLTHVGDIKATTGDQCAALDRFKPEVVLCDQRWFKRLEGSRHGELLRRIETAGDGADERPPTGAVQPDAPAVCLFTSGSTGDPKGVVLSHANMLAGGAALVAAHGLAPRDRVLALTPFAGINGQTFTIWAPLVSGGSAIWYQGMFSPAAAMAWAFQHQATWINGTPTFLALFNSHVASEDHIAGADIKFFRSASAPLRRSAVEAFEGTYGIPVVNTLGMSEMAGQVFANPIEFGERRVDSVGRPWATEVRIVDEQSDPCAIGEAGDIEVRGPGMMIGYLDDADATAEAIVDGWLRTGDLGYVDDTGYVYVTGRKKDIAIVSGVNVSLREVDDALHEIPGVELALSFVVPDDVTGERLVAAVQAVGNDLELEMLVMEVRSRLAGERRPKELLIWDAIPTGATGKLLRPLAVERYLNDSTKEIAP